MASSDANKASAAFNTAANRAGWPSLCDATLSFMHPDFRPLVELWRSAAAEGRLPRRSDVDLKRLKTVLPAMTMYERVANGSTRYKVRLMGTVFAEAMGDLSGKFIDEAVPGEHLPRWQAALDAAYAAGAPLRFLGQLDVSDKDYLVAEYFEAPLLAEDGSPSFVLAAGHFMPRRWTDVAETETKRLNLQPHFQIRFDRSAHQSAGL